MKSILASTLTVFILSHNFVYADELQNTSQTSQSETQKTSDFHFAIGLNKTSFVYQEPNMKQTGFLNGADLMLHYQINPDVALMGQATYLTGQLDYDGFYLYSGLPAKGVDHYTVQDLTLSSQFKTDISLENPTSFLVGLGHRETTDANDPSPSDYKRIHFYNYYLLGLQVDIPHSESSTSWMQFGLENLISGHVKTNLSDVDPSLPDVDPKFKGGSALMLNLSHSEKFDFGILYGGIHLKKWSLESSEVVQVKINGQNEYLVEPENTTTTISFNAGMIF